MAAEAAIKAVQVKLSSYKTVSKKEPEQINSFLEQNDLFSKIKEKGDRY